MGRGSLQPEDEALAKLFARYREARSQGPVAMDVFLAGSDPEQLKDLLRNIELFKDTSPITDTFIEESS